MNEHELRAQLQRAEPTPSLADSPAGYGDRIRQLSARRRRRQMGLITASATACLALIAFVAWRPNRAAPEVVVAPVDVAPVEADPAAQLVAIRRAASDAKAAADAIRARRKLAELEAEAERASIVPDPILLVELQVETTAARRLAEGERAAAAGDVRSAAQSYERVLALFPTSRASALAEVRLAQLKIN